MALSRKHFETIAGITGRGKNRFFLNGLFYLVVDGLLGSIVASVDSYTPPAPAWDRPDVRMIMRRSDPAIKMYRSTLYGATLPDLWRSVNRNGVDYSTAEVSRIASDWVVYAVAPEVGEE